MKRGRKKIKFPAGIEPTRNRIAARVLGEFVSTYKIPVPLFPQLSLYCLESHSGRRIYFRKSDLNRELNRLHKRGYVALVKQPDGLLIRLLKKGRRRLRQQQIKELCLPTKHSWDGKWRLYIFDIPEELRSKRDLIRAKLKSLGMYNIQRSVLAYPFDCREELALLADYYGISQFATYADAF